MMTFMMPETRLDRPRPRRDQQAERAERHRSEHRRSTASSSIDPRSGTPNASTPNPDRHADFEHEQHHAPDQERHQVVGLRHRRRDEPLHQLAAPRIDDREPEAPDGVAHDAHADEAGHQEVDVARARLADQVVLDRHGIDAAARHLQRPIGSRARRPRLGIRVVVPDTTRRRLAPARRRAAPGRSAAPAPPAPASAAQAPAAFGAEGGDDRLRTSRRLELSPRAGCETPRRVRPR